VETNLVFICKEQTFDHSATREMIKAWNSVGVDYKKCKIRLDAGYLMDGVPMSEWGVKAYILVGSEIAEQVIGFPFTNLGRLETFAGQCFLIPGLDKPVFPIYSPYVCNSSGGATQFYRWISNFWNAYNNPVTIKSNFEASQTNISASKYNPPPIDSSRAIDTEFTKDKLWSVQLFPDQQIFYKDETINTVNTPLVYHSALADVVPLKRAGYRPQVKGDTLLLAYHLDLPLGLKELTVRELGVVMTPYTDIVREALKNKLKNTFSRVIAFPEFNVRDGRKHSIAMKTTRLLKKLEEGIEPQELWVTWNDKAHADMREQVEKQFGVLEYPTLDEVDFEKAKEYAIKDPIATYHLYNTLAPRVLALNAWSAYRTDIAIIPMVASMQENGIPIDMGRVEQLKVYIKDAKEAALKKLQDKYGEQFNPASPDDALEALEGSGAKLTKKTDGGKLSTGKQVLKGLADTNETAKDILDYRVIAKLDSTYVPALTNYIGEDGKVHPVWRTSNTDTGRLSCSNPNVMAFPERSEVGKRFKKCFKAPEGWVFANADLDQIEMRFLASEANCVQMIKAIKEKLDLHTHTASLMFNVDYDKVDKKTQRYPAKTINFLMVYEGSAQKLMEGMAAEGIHEPKEHWQGLMDNWFKVYPEIREYQRLKHVEAEIKGFVTDFWGNVRHVEGARSCNRMSASECMRQASNFPIQSGAQVLIKRAMARIWQIMQMPKWKDNVQIIMQIHDELVFLIRKGSESFMEDVVKVELMRDQSLLKVPLSSSVGFGESWGDLK